MNSDGSERSLENNLSALGEILDVEFHKLGEALTDNADGNT